jgi:hypothetical protein
VLQEHPAKGLVLAHIKNNDIKYREKWKNEFIYSLDQN